MTRRDSTSPAVFCRVHSGDGVGRGGKKEFSPLRRGDFNRLQAVRLAQLPTVALHLFTTSPLKSCNVKCHVVYSTSTINPRRIAFFFSYSSPVNYVRGGKGSVEREECDASLVVPLWSTRGGYTLVRLESLREDLSCSATLAFFSIFIS